MSNTPPTQTLLITGANRGLGLEFCRQYAAANYQVIACCRNPEKANALTALAAKHDTLHIFALDVTDHDAIEALAEELHLENIDVLISNAGIYGDSGLGFGHLDYAAWRMTLETNVLSAMKLAEAFQPHLQRSTQGLFVAMSSLMGSIADNGGGGSILYRSSKAALNAAMKSLAIDLSAQEIGVLIFHPGWVRTDMGGPNGLIDTEESIKGMRNIINNFTLAQSGQFIKYDGTPMPW